MTRRIVFDTTTILSALLFASGRLAWLRQHWRDSDSDAGCIPLISHATAAELNRVLGYPKFHLSADDRTELLAEYLPYCKIVEALKPCLAICRDPNDQPFLDLAQSGKAQVLVSGDKDLLTLAGQTTFSIETPEAYRRRLSI